MAGVGSCRRWLANRWIGREKLIFARTRWHLPERTGRRLETARLRNAIGYAGHYTRSHDAVIRVYEEPGNELDEADLYWGRIAIQDWQ